MSRRRPWKSVLIALTTAGVLALSACSTATPATPGAPASPTGAPVAGGVLTYLEAQPHTSLYPPTAGFYPNGGLVNNLTDRLVHQNPETLEFEPWIATAWQVNADATEYTFTLRDDVTFSDGTKLDAAAVAKNFDLYGKGDAARALPVSEAINNYAGSEVVDATTVRFRFSAPAPGFLQATSTINSGLLSPATLEGDYTAYGAGNGAKVIGSGPFVVASEKVGSEVVLAARADYAWAPKSATNQGRAYLDEVRYVVTPEAGVRVGSLTSKQADIARQVAAPDEAVVEASGASLVAPQTRGVNNSFSLRFRNDLLADKTVRQALSLGTDRQEVVDTLFTDNYPLATSVIGRTALGWTDLSSRLVHDPAKARELLDAAGWVPGADGVRVRDGQRLALVVNEAAPQPRSYDVTTLVSQQWKRDLGVDLQILRADAGTFAKAINDADQVQVYHSMVGRADLDVIKSQYAAKNRNTLLNRDPADNSIGDPKLEELLAAVAGTADAGRRVAASQTVQEYLLEQFYVIPLFEEPQVFAVGPQVHGFAAESVGRPSFHATWVRR